MLMEIVWRQRFSGLFRPVPSRRIDANLLALLFHILHDEDDLDREFLRDTRIS